jgi:Tfp pilus assembly protein PilO
MNSLTAKNKIIAIATAWVVVSALMLFYFFGILDASNQQMVDAIAKEKKDLQTLQAQNQSYLQAKADLKQLEEKEHQPEDFFSKDITLVNELRVLEGLKTKFNLQMQITGIAGSLPSLPKAKTASSLAMVPYSISATGNFSDVLDFIETLQNLNFITNITNVSVRAAERGQVSVGMAASFYIRK